MWTSRPEFQGHGLPKGERVQCLLNLVALQKWYEQPNHAKLSEVDWPKLMRNVYVDWSQNPVRKAYSGKHGELNCLCTSSNIYSFQEDRAFFPVEYLRLQGWGFDVNIPDESLPKIREMSGQGMALPCLAGIIWAVYLLRALPTAAEAAEP